MEYYNTINHSPVVVVHSDRQTHTLNHNYNILMPQIQIIATCTYVLCLKHYSNLSLPVDWPTGKLPTSSTLVQGHLWLLGKQK